MNDRVWVVDDQPSMCELIETALRPRNFEVTSFTSADDALRAMSEIRPGKDLDVVLTDYKMPGTTGLELCERVAANRPGIGSTGLFERLMRQRITPST